MTPQEAYWMAHKAGKRLPELEHIILTDRCVAFTYAEKIIKGRWIEAEEIIMKSTILSHWYASDIIRGKLPDKMHNMMILRAIEDSNDWCVKAYFELIK